jgi:hypothetical protein
LIGFGADEDHIGVDPCHTKRGYTAQALQATIERFDRPFMTTLSSRTRNLEQKSLDGSGFYPLFER